MKRSNTLTTEQLAVVNHDGGHALVEAVPGSGKTTTLVARLRRTLRMGADPAGILVVMFNKDAQLSFEGRLRHLVGDGKAIPAVRTFNALGNAILKRLVSMGALPAWELRTSSAAMDRLARPALKKAWLRIHGNGARPSAEQYQSFLQFITLVKAQLEPARKVWQDTGYTAICKPFIDAFENVLQAQRQSRVMFFDDQIYRPVIALQADPSLWKHFQDRYDEICIDEFQDINDACFAMVRGLAGSRSDVICVGDANQSIYQWRGSRVAIMTEEFARAFPCQVYPLSYTFRCGPRVALLADHLISHNQVRSQALMIAAAGNIDTQVELMPVSANAPSGLVDLLIPYASQGTLHDATMLARNFSHLVPYELELSEAGISFHVYGREGLLYLPEIAALVCAVSLVASRWIIEPEDRCHFLFSMLSTPTPFVAHSVLQSLAEQLDDAIDRDTGLRLHQIIEQTAKSLRTDDPRGAASLDQRADAVRLLTSGSLTNAAAGAVVQAYIRMTGMTDVIRRSAATPEQATEALSTLNAFVGLAERSGTTAQFLDILSPLAAHKEDVPPEGDHVRLTTIHRAKGLEWPLVMVVGLSKGIFPDGDPTRVEEERRLAYVAFTRAMERLVLFHPRDGTLDRSRRELNWEIKQPGSASPFLYEAEVGLSDAIVQAMPAGQAVRIDARVGAVATDYLSATGNGHVSLVLSPEATRLEALRKSRRLLPVDFVASVGDQLFHDEHGLCTVLDVFHPPIYRVQSKVTGETFSAVLDQANGWYLGRATAQV